MRKSIQVEQRGKLKGSVFGITKPRVTLTRFTWRKNASSRTSLDILFPKYKKSCFWEIEGKSKLLEEDIGWIEENEQKWKDLYSGI